MSDRREKEMNEREMEELVERDGEKKDMEE